MLLYHRVADLQSDPQCLAVSPERFAAHLEIIADRGVPMTLSSLVDGARTGTLPVGAVALTFDDGYADALHCAAPLLARARVPATLFVATGHLERCREFWWDELERLLLSPGSLPVHLRLRIGLDLLEWQLGDSAARSERDCAQQASWMVTDRRCPTPRHRLYQDLCRRLREVTGEVRDRTLDELSAWARSPRHVRATHRPLQAGEIVALAHLEHVTIGSHTDSHPSLACLPPEEQRREIAGARQRLRTLTGTAVTSLAYPFGGGADVSDRTTAIAREEGVTLACCTHPGRVRRETSPHRVPRVIVRNWPPCEFERQWSDWTAAP